MDIHSLRVDAKDNASIYVGTAEGLYHSNNRGQSYQLVLHPRGEMAAVNDILISDDQIFAATDVGLYRSTDDAVSWQKVYDSSDADWNKCLSILMSTDHMYLGTAKGVLHKPIEGSHWYRLGQSLYNRAVHGIVENDEIIYFATDQALFAMDKQTMTTSQTFSLGIRKEAAIKQIQSIQVTDKRVYLATTKGIYFKLLEESQWRQLPSDQIALDQLTDILIIPTSHGEAIIASTKKGAVFLDQEAWVPLYKGMESNEVTVLEKDSDGNVYAATDRGVFYLPIGEMLPSFFDAEIGDRPLSGSVRGLSPIPANEEFYAQYQKITDAFSNEPDIREVHSMVIAYAQVSPNKIKRWQDAARKRAWYPQLSVGLDGGNDQSESDSIYGTSSGSDHQGPDDKTAGRDFGWDISLSWDLSDVIFNSEQTSIDSRAKLMVELREDLLDQVTRLFFARRRIQMEQLMDAVIDPALKLEKDIRIAEMTALIDAMTGGEFSEFIQRQEKEAGYESGRN